MMKPLNLIVLIILLLTTACSEGVEQKQSKSPNAIQEKVDSFIQPRIHALEKAKALEGKLQKLEEKRLDTIRKFEDNTE